jgi:hypothetical protein
MYKKANICRELVKSVQQLDLDDQRHYLYQDNQDTNVKVCHTEIGILNKIKKRMFDCDDI